MSDRPSTGDARRRFSVSRLTLTDFRCYAHLRLDIDARPVVLYGDNGAGKTNILEAVSMLVPGRGFRRATLSELARSGGDGRWAVASTVETPTGPVGLGTGFTPPDLPEGSERRQVRVDGETAPNQNVLTDHFSAHWLVPQMDRLFIDGASARRRFLDRLVFAWDPAHSGRITAYEHAARQRLKLLKDNANPDPAWLSALEDGMAGRAVAVAAARIELLARIGQAAADGMAPFPGAVLALDGLVESWLAGGPALEAEDRFRERLAADRGRDGEQGRTSSGPHRTDLLVRHGAKDEAAERCSTGEQKALLIAIILANARVRADEEGGVPVLLLDEVAAHLDEMRRGALFGHLVDLGAQAWLTGTDAALFAGLECKAQFFSVDHGTVTAT